MTDAHQHALKYAALGLKVLPIRPGGKHPPMSSWQHAATDDRSKIDNWFNGLYSKCGVGIALGTQPNGQHLFALDIDRHGDIDGHDELHDLEQANSPLPDTWRAITGSGGTHIILAAPAGIEVRNQQSHGNRLGTSIDVRGEGGQIVAAPTLHPDTLNAYVWEDGHEPWTIPVADAPQWVIDLVAEPPPPPKPAPTPPTQPRRNDDLFDAHRNDWDWHSELLRRGWTETRSHGNDTYWTRPGKNPKDGHSAVLHGIDGPLVIFTTEIDDTWTRAGTRTIDGSGWSFGPFGFYAATEHAGDRSQAARSLAERYQVTIAPDWQFEPSDEHTDTTEPTIDYDEQLLGMLLDWPTFFATDHTAEEWLWEPIIPARRGLVIWAKGGSGKSLVMLRLAVDLAQQGTRILYLDYEMSPDDLADRLTEMGIDDPANLATLHYAQLPTLPAFDTPQGGMAVNRLAQLVDAELVIIDTFARAVQGEENDADTVRQFYRMTGMHLKAAGRAFVRIDHSGKDEAKGQRGSSAKNDDVDLVWHLKPAQDGYTLTRGKCRMGWVPETVALHRQDAPYRLSVEDRQTYEPGTVDTARLLDELRIPVDAGERPTRKTISDAGQAIPPRKLLRDAIRYRRNRTSTRHLTGDDPLDWDTNNAAETVDNTVGAGRRTPRRTPAHPKTAQSAAHPGADTQNPRSEGTAHPAAQRGAPKRDDAAQCATRSVAQCASPPPAKPRMSMFDDEDEE